MILTGLKTLHKDMIKNNMSFDVFNYEHNRIEFSVFFDVGTSPHYTLIFIKKQSDMYLKLEVESNYYLNTFLGDKLSRLLNILELGGRGGTFSTNSFFEEFNSNIPATVTNAMLDKRTITRVSNSHEEDKIYIRELRYWDKYPHLDRNVSKRNREKTRILYPEIYESIKDKNVSVFYTEHEAERFNGVVDRR